MLDQETTLRNRVDELEAEGRYPEMVAPLEELVSLLRHRNTPRRSTGSAACTET